jgi:hypothetical protein
VPSGQVQTSSCWLLICRASTASPPRDRLTGLGEAIGPNEPSACSCRFVSTARQVPSIIRT